MYKGALYLTFFFLMLPVKAYRRLFEALTELEITSLVLWAVSLFRRTLLAPFFRVEVKIETGLFC